MSPKFHPLFNTPQGRAQLDAIDGRLESRLRQNLSPLAEAAAWHDHRRERYIEPGLEGLTGPASAYHFEDTVRYIISAARTLAGKTYGMPTPAAKRPKAALSTLNKCYGWRYLWGIQGLQDALRVDSQPANLERFNAQCQAFDNAFKDQLFAAAIVNAHGENPNAAVEAVRMLARQMLDVCMWLELTREGRRAGELRRLIEEALETLHTPACLPEKSRRKKRQPRNY